MSISVESLPVELETELLRLVPELRFANLHYYCVYNDMFRQRLFNEGGSRVEEVLFECQDQVIAYTKSFDCVKKATRGIISRALRLKDQRASSAKDIYSCQYIGDSWMLIYYLVKYRKLFPNKTDFVMQPSDRYLHDDGCHVTLVERTNSLQFEKEIYLTAGLYNLSVALMIYRFCLGLGTIRFRVEVYSGGSSISVQNTWDFYTATNIDDMAPKNTFFVLNLGLFHVYNDTTSRNTFHRVRIVMEETGLNLKSGFRFFYFDLKPPGMYLQDQYVFWALNEPLIKQLDKNSYSKLVNIVEKNAVLKLEQVIASLYGSSPLQNPAVSNISPDIDLKQLCWDFCVLRKDNPIKRRIKFVTIIGQREFNNVTRGILYDKLNLGEGNAILRWRTNWL